MTMALFKCLSTFYNCCVAKDASLLRKHFSLFIVGTFLMTIIQHFLFQTYSKRKKLILVEFVNMGCFFPHILLTYPMCHTVSFKSCSNLAVQSCSKC